MEELEVVKNQIRLGMGLSFMQEVQTSFPYGKANNKAAQSLPIKL